MALDSYNGTEQGQFFSVVCLGLTAHRFTFSLQADLDLIIPLTCETGNLFYKNNSDNWFLLIESLKTSILTDQFQLTSHQMCFLFAPQIWLAHNNKLETGLWMNG